MALVKDPDGTHKILFTPTNNSEGYVLDGSSFLHAHKSWQPHYKKGTTLAHRTWKEDASVSCTFRTRTSDESGGHLTYSWRQLDYTDDHVRMGVNLGNELNFIDMSQEFRVVMSLELVPLPESE